MCNGYIILKIAYFWDTFILASGPLFASAVSATERETKKSALYECVAHRNECSVVIEKLIR